MCVVMAFICCLSLTGCIDAMPDMTEEQQALVAEYAADLLLKHSKYYDNGLADLDKIQEAEAVVEEPEPEFVEEDEEDILEDEEALQDERQEGTEEATELTDVSLAEALDLEKIDIIFEQYEITDAYPNDNAAFFVNAPQGKKMLVMHFSLKNLSSESVECDIASIEPKIYVSVNDSGDKKAMSTPLLLDDFTTYKGTIAAEDSVSCVVITEVDGDMTEEEVSHISISVDVAEGRLVASLL